MEKQAMVKQNMLCFANYLAAWCEHFDNLGYFEVAEGITHVITHMVKEASELSAETEEEDTKEDTA